MGFRDLFMKTDFEVWLQQHDKKKGQEGSAAFAMAVNEISSVRDHVLVSGTVRSGSVQPGDILLGSSRGRTFQCSVLQINVGHIKVKKASEGQEASLLLKGVRKEDLSTGTVLRRKK
ncbi:MAG: hypothetical protein IKE21_03505 [Erysipelotrichaceae bacterium]|nr:hypothetical protein [Erysipelotrichaceae bacterium]